VYAWLDRFPQGSILISVSFQDGSELLKDPRDIHLWHKPYQEVLEQDRRRAFYEEESTGLPSSHAFTEDAKKDIYAWRGYIEIEGVHPFERSLNLVDANEKEIFLSAVGILLRRLLVAYPSTRIYCGGDTLLRFLSTNLKNVHAFIEQANADLRTTAVNIRKPCGTITSRRSGLYLELSEYHRCED
jgi:hypothetical protein